MERTTFTQGYPSAKVSFIKQTVRRFLAIATAFTLFFLLESGCREKIVDRPYANQPPQTYLWLFPDSTLSVGVSRQRLRWWGEDPDGIIVGYLFSFAIVPSRTTSIPNPDTLRYTFVTSNDTLMAFPLDTLFRNFTVVVRAVDNAFAKIPHQSIVRMTPRPYWDKNDNGIDDAGDMDLPTLSGAVDIGGAVQTFPVRNTPPTIAFAQDPHDPNRSLKQPDTTFTVATFAFKGTDFDGDNTLASYRIALNDTSTPSRWMTISLRDTIITLAVPRARSDGAGGEVDADVFSGTFLGSRNPLGQLPGLRLDALNVFYVQVKDVAGEFSQTLRMPTGTNHWYVKRPRGKILLVADYTEFDSTLALTSYRSALDAVPGGEFQSADLLPMGRGVSAQQKADPTLRTGPMVPQFIDPALIRTFLLYDYVLWYADRYPSLPIAQLSIFPYLQNNGKVIFSTSFLTVADTRGALRDFAPIDSVSTVDNLGLTWNPGDPPRLGDSRLYANYKIIPDSSVPGEIYPLLAANSTPSRHTVFWRTIYKRSDARYIYRLQPDTVASPNGPRYVGSPNIGVVDGQRSIIFIGIPIHLLNNTTLGEGLTAFFTKTLLGGFAFNPNREVDRRRF